MSSQIQGMTLYMRLFPYRCELQKHIRPSVSPPPPRKKKRDIMGLLNILQFVYAVQGIVAFHDYEVFCESLIRSEVNLQLYVNNRLVGQQQTFRPRLLNFLSVTQFQGCQSGENRKKVLSTKDNG